MARTQKVLSGIQAADDFGGIEQHRVQAGIGGVAFQGLGLTVFSRLVKVGADRKNTVAKVAHPHIASDPAICGGSAVISGTRFPVRSVVAYVLQRGLTPEELVAKFPHLTLAKVHDALAYYYDNRSEIDREIVENREENVRKQLSS